MDRTCHQVIADHHRDRRVILSKDQPNPLDLVQSHLNCQVGQVLNQLIRNQPNQPNQLQSPRRVSNLNHLIYHGSIQRVIIVRSVGIQGTNKNGKSCKRCWRQFATRNSATPMGGPTVVTTPNTYYSGLPFGDYLHPFSQPTYQYGAPPMQIGGQAPIYVRPGDPRLGGVVCGECRGTGRVRFFLDEDLCPLCNGVGRIVR